MVTNGVIRRLAAVRRTAFSGRDSRSLFSGIELAFSSIPQSFEHEELFLVLLMAAIGVAVNPAAAFAVGLPLATVSARVAEPLYEPTQNREHRSNLLVVVEGLSVRGWARQDPSHAALPSPRQKQARETGHQKQRGCRFGHELQIVGEIVGANQIAQ